MMRETIALATTLFILALATPASALDNLNGFSLKGNILDPLDMTCKAFLRADDNMKMFVSAWWDGNSSTFVGKDEVSYSESDVKSMYESLIKGCEEEPDSTLEEIGFDYGGEGTTGKPTCSLLAGMPNAEKASELLVWTLGYIADDSGGETDINVGGFKAFGNEIFAQCKGQPRGNLIRMVMSYQGIGDDSGDAGGGKDIDN
jgi:hypothetical protein